MIIGKQIPVIPIEFTEEERQKANEVIPVLTELINTMKMHNCDTIVGAEVDVSIRILETLAYDLECIAENNFYQITASL